jgi:hypothetical protein
MIVEMHSRQSTTCSSNCATRRRFSHPVAVLPRAAISLNNGDAVILSINSTGPRGELCSDFSVRVMVGPTPVLFCDGMLVCHCACTCYP